jgi:phage shock protein PspC (stress-responsive transcriptional regulator)
MEKIVGKERKVLFRNMVGISSTTYGTFGLYRYPAKFIPHVVAYILETYTKPKMTVFDPFAGYGTVGIVSRIYGCDYELWDLNPLLETFHKIATLEPREVKAEELVHQMITSDEEHIPKWSNLHYWFPEEFLPLLFKAWGFYHSLNDGYLKLILTIPLLKTTRYFSYDDMQRQKLSKSPKSKKRVNSLLNCDWRTKFYQMVSEEIKKVVEGIQEYWKLSPKQVRAIVKGGVDTLSTELQEERDILITSPPYLQSHEYIRQAKMNLFWLGYPEDKVRKLSNLEIPYRDVEPQQIHSKTFHQWRDEIEENHIRKVFERYFWGVLGALTRLQKKVCSYLFLFIGSPSMRGRSVPIDRIFAEHFTALGWTHEVTLRDTIVSRQMFSYRFNPATGIKDKRTKMENLVILKRK